MKCEEVEKHLEMYVDGELSLNKREKVAIHLETCENCENKLQEEVKFRQTVRENIGKYTTNDTVVQSVKNNLLNPEA